MHHHNVTPQHIARARRAARLRGTDNLQTVEQLASLIARLEGTDPTPTPVPAPNRTAAPAPPETREQRRARYRAELDAFLARCAARRGEATP